MIETLLWVYIVFCFALILFQCLFIAIIALRSYIDRLVIKRRFLEIVKQLERISGNMPVAKKHKKFLETNMILTSALYPYEKALDRVRTEIENGTLALRDPNERTKVIIDIRHRAVKDDEKSKGHSKIRLKLRPKKSLITPLPKDLADLYFKEYIRQTAPCIVSLTSSYRKKDKIPHMFYVFMLKKYGYLRYHHTSELIANLQDLLDDGDSVCAEGIMLAIYQTGDPDITLEILKQADQIDRFLHPKIVSDGLLSYPGNRGELQELLLDRLSEFSESMQVNLLNYLRFASGAHCARVLELLQNDKTYDEVRFSCIRYLGKYPYEPAYPLLAHFASGGEKKRIEYAIVSLAVLRYYPSQQTIDILRTQINHLNWFVRYNATESLESLGIEYQDLIDIFDGKDRFARDMLQYQFDQRYILDQEV